MSKEKKSGRSKKFEDFISSSPETFRFISDNEMKLWDEHVEIITALSSTNRTVKEIHRLYLLDEEGPVFSKTLKTVYRHLDTLENSGLIKVAGYRKYEGSRQTEKLYCRSARIFLPADTAEAEWWKSKDGRVLIKKIVSVAKEFFQLPEAKSQEMVKMLAEIYDAWDQTVRKLFEETTHNENLAEIVSKAELKEIRDIVQMIGTFGIISQNQELLERMRNWLKE